MKNKELYNDLTNYIKNYRKEDNIFIRDIIKKTSFVFSDFTYGSTPYESAIKVIKKVKKTPKRFVVVGTSIGWMNFYWNEIYPTIPTLGIDIHNGRIDFGNSMIKEYNLKNIKLEVGDLYKFKFKESDLVWMSNLCFDNKSVQSIMKKIIVENPNIGLISYKPIHYEKKYVSKYEFPVSWGDSQNFYIYEKK